jgi:hypothetical protein
LCAANTSSAWHTGRSGGAPDSVRCPRLADGEPAALENRWSCTAKIHRTVRWCTGLSGESSARRSRETEKATWLKFTGLSGGAPDCSVSQRSPAPTVGREICGRHVDCSNGQLVHRTVSGAPTGPEEKQSDAPDLEGDRAPDMNSGCPVVHRTVRCTTRQKAGIAFQDCLQRLLAALGL